MREANTEMGGPGGPAFPPTRWTAIRDATDPASPTRTESLDSLSRLYWKPVYAYFRRTWDLSNEEAKERTQEFFLMMLETDLLERVAPERGHFRGYVKASLDNFVRRHKRDEGRLKRGGGARPIPLEAMEGFEPASGDTPDQAFRREWIRTVVDDSIRELGELYSAEGKDTAFQLLRLYDIDRPAGADLSYESLAKRFSIPVTDVTILLYRARKKLRDLVQKRVRDTVASEDDARAEMDDLFKE